MILVLFQPQIPQNTGNIMRTCIALGASLVLVRPLGFQMSARQKKRASLDYEKLCPTEEIDDLEEYLESCSSFFFFSSKAEKSYVNVSYEKDAVLIFGNETAGLPYRFWEKWPEKFLTVPMEEKCRCLNLANTCAVVGFEVRRQLYAAAK